MIRYVVNVIITASTMTNGVVTTQSQNATDVQLNTMTSAQTLKTEQTPDSPSV